MRVTLELDEQEQWVEFKDSLTRRDLREWREALDTNDYEVVLGLMAQWSSACHIVDVDGNAYGALEDIDAEGIDALDYAVLDFLANLPIHVRQMRSSLGKVSGGQ